MSRAGTRRSNALTYRVIGGAMLVMAAFLAWKTHWFHTEASLSSYPQRDLTYSTAKYEVVTHSRGLNTVPGSFISCSSPPSATGPPRT